jgi:ribonuclease P protein component
MPHAADNKPNNSFPKHDKLKSSLTIEKLYGTHQFVLSHPLKCYFLFSETTEDKSSVRVAFSAPKKIFKNAVDRNTLKRRMREAYRINYKNILEQFINQKDKQLQLLFIYIGKEVANYKSIEKSMQIILHKQYKLTVNLKF